MAEKLTLIREFKGGKLFKNEKDWPVVFLTHVRLSFPSFLEPYIGDDAKEGDLGKFKGTFMVDKVTGKDQMLACKGVIEELLKDNNAKELEADRKFIRNGDTQDRPEYENHFTISASSKKRPKLRSMSNENVDRDDIEDVFRSGYYVDVLFSPYYQDGVKVGKGYGRRVNATLLAVKMNEKAEEFAGGGISEDDVDSVFGGATSGGGGGGFDDDDDL